MLKDMEGELKIAGGVNIDAVLGKVCELKIRMVIIGNVPRDEPSDSDYKAAVNQMVDAMSAIASLAIIGEIHDDNDRIALIEVLRGRNQDALPDHLNSQIEEILAKFD